MENSVSSRSTEEVSIRGCSNGLKQIGNCMEFNGMKIGAYRNKRLIETKVCPSSLTSFFRYSIQLDLHAVFLPLFPPRA